MKNQFFFWFKFAFFMWLGTLLYLNCATSSALKTQAEYRAEIRQLQNEPPTLSNLQRLGIAYYKTRQYARAREYLIKCFKREPRDPQTLMYLGMTFEAIHDRPTALKIYQRFRRLSEKSPYKKTLEMRYRRLVRKMMHEEMQQLVANETTLTDERLESNAIAVFPLTYVGQNEKYAALGKGLSEMLITDLSQVRGLKLTERLRLQALLDEMTLGQTDLVDRATAPRFGKLLGAAKIIHGSFDVLNDQQLQIDVAFWDVKIQAFPEFSRKTDALENLFRLEKDLTFRIIQQMGIELSPLEQEKIQRLPTQNFQAFMAYCMGLEKEDNEQFNAAVNFYQLALNLDPGFARAHEKLNQNLGLTPAAPGKEDTDWVVERLNTMGANLGTGLLPGQESRNSAGEIQNAGAEVFGDLPTPPRPPGR